MAFFENLSRKVQDVAFAAAEKGKEVAAIASEKAQDAADTVKTNVAIAGEQRAIEKNYRAIGEWYVSELKGEAPEAVADIVAAIRASQAKIAALQGEDAPVEAECADVTEAAPAEAPVEGRSCRWRPRGSAAPPWSSPQWREWSGSWPCHDDRITLHMTEAGGVAYHLGIKHLTGGALGHRPGDHPAAGAFAIQRTISMSLSAT